MRALELRRPQPVEAEPLAEVERPALRPGPGQILIRVRACGVCHTDLHLVEGDLPPVRLPLVPGHQIVGTVAELGKGVGGWQEGEAVGVAWLHSACGRCPACLRGEENLCADAEFTGWHHDGGYAEWTLARADYAHRLPPGMSGEAAAPLLCAGIIGYRSLRKAEIHPGERVGLIGFGASAHLALQVARHWSCPTAVFTRSDGHRRLARELGAEWVGGVEDPAPWPLDRAVLFAPSGALVPVVLEKLRPGGTLAINAIHMSPIPPIPYSRLYGERTVRSVANATRRDAAEFLELAAEARLHSVYDTYPLGAANRALADMKHSRLKAAAVLVL